MIKRTLGDSDTALENKNMLKEIKDKSKGLQPPKLTTSRM